mgnify:CR=1 FL=1
MDNAINRIKQKGTTLLEALVATAIIGIGFIAIFQMVTYSVRSIDVSGESPVEYRGLVPERSVVIPGSYTKTFLAGDYQVPCALIIGQRKESTDKKTSLNSALREHDVAV